MSKSRKSNISTAIVRPSSRLLLLGLTTYLITSCFYVFPSGQPQPADYLMSAIIVAAVLTGIIRAQYVQLLIILVSFFCLYVTIVGIFNFLLYEDYHTIISPIYYIYNTAIMVIVASVCQTSPNETRRHASFAAVVIITIELFAIIVELHPPGNRDIGTFNDPNQLGYMTILTLMVKLIAKEDRLIRLSDIYCILISLIIILETQSRSAIVGWMVMLFGAIIFLNMPRALIFGMVFISFLIFLASSIDYTYLQLYTFENESIARLIQRFGETGPDDDFEGRGYYLLFQYPEHLVFGAGEGARFRFSREGPGGEIHSTWANILFSYGVIGFGLFCSMLFVVFRRAELFHIVLFLGPAGYGMSTYGARFSMFWVVLGLVYGFARSGREKCSGQFETPLKNRINTH